MMRLYHVAPNRMQPAKSVTKSQKHPISRCDIWVFPKIGVPQNGRFLMENPIKIHDLGVPLFLETPIFTCVSLGSQ